MIDSSDDIDSNTFWGNLKTEKRKTYEHLQITTACCPDNSKHCISNVFHSTQNRKSKSNIILSVRTPFPCYGHIIVSVRTLLATKKKMEHGFVAERKYFKGIQEKKRNIYSSAPSLPAASALLSKLLKAFPPTLANHVHEARERNYFPAGQNSFSHCRRHRPRAHHFFHMWVANAKLKHLPPRGRGVIN
jgi:hypothetical protein